MVIQRIQSVYLFFAALVTIAVGLFVPIVSDGENSFSALALGQGVLPLIVICMITAALQLLDIFLFSNLKLQMKVAVMSAIMVWASVFVWVYIVAFKLAGAFSPCWVWPAICFGVSYLLTGLAQAGMKADYKKLKSYDRLW